MILAYERDKITEVVGSQEAKTNFLQKFGRIAHFSKDFTQFFSSGIYQLEGGPPILILPWFLKPSVNKIADFKNEADVGSFFQTVKEINDFKECAIDLQIDPNGTTALDILVFSYLKRLSDEIRKLMSYNFHQDITEKTNVIRGRWEIPKDISQGKTPVKFTCSYNSFDIDIPFFTFVKSFARQLSKMIKSRHNLTLIDDILKNLSEVEGHKITRALVLDAIDWAKKQKREYLISSIEFAESLLVEQKIYSPSTGTSFQFQMDRFFENLMVTIFKGAQQYTVQPQTREELLGGAVWRPLNATESTMPEEKKAVQQTIPDIVVFNSNSFLIFECKYKPLRIPFINYSDFDQNLISFSRNDRNQLLSFIMSLRPSPELTNKQIEFSIIFPANNVQDFEVSELFFESAKLYVDPIVRNLIQNKLKSIGGKGLSIKFVGININAAINDVISKSNLMGESIIQKVRNEMTLNNDINRQASEFQQQVEKRVLLTSLIVNKSKNDRTLGRVKMAKIFYLADAHLKLGMGGRYIREAAGPLDQRILYNQSWGIEAQGEKQSYYKRVETKGGGNRYLPLNNLEKAISKAKSVFADKIENIENIINLLSKLDTERSEIVSTLYACWNDLLSKKSEVTDIEIVSDFLTNWHQSKKRFDRDRLLIAVRWMKENGLVPDGKGPISLLKEEKMPVGF